MTSLSSLLSFAIFALFAAGFFFYLYLVIKRATRKSRVASITPEMQAMLNTEVVLTPEEQKSMGRSLAVSGVLVGAVLLGLVVITGFNYYRFVMTGQEVSASIVNKTSHRSSGRHSHTSYTYTLQAIINGTVVNDSYSAGSSGGYKVGDTVRAYATKEAPPQLAIAATEDRDPFLEVLYLACLGGFIFLVVRQRIRIRSGKMRLAMLPEKFRKDRLRAMRASVPIAGVTADATLVTPMPRPTTPSGLPTYTIGPGKEGNDGSNYKV